MPLNQYSFLLQRRLFTAFLFQSIEEDFKEIHRFEDVQINGTHLLLGQVLGVFCHYSRVVEEFLGSFVVVEVAAAGHGFVSIFP